MDRRDEALAKLALGLKIVDANGLNRAVKLSAQFPGRSLDLLLELAGIIDAPARKKLVVAWNERVKQLPGLAPLPLPDAPKTGAHPAPAQPPPAPKTGAHAALPPKVAPRTGAHAAPPPPPKSGPHAPPAAPPARPARTPELKKRDLSDSDLLALPPDDDSGRVLQVPDDDGFDPMGSEDTTGLDEEAILAQPTMVLKDDDPAAAIPVVMVESAEEEPAPRALTESQEDAIYAQPTMIVKDEPKLSDEDAIYAEPTMIVDETRLALPPDEEELLAQPTVVLQDSGELTLKDSGDDRKKKSDSGLGALDVDLRLGRDVSLSESQKLKGKGGPVPGVKSKKGEGPLTRDEFQRRLKMRQGFEGFSVGDYKVVTEIARGAFGVVLQVEAGGTAKSLARERGYDGNMALKVMLENKTDPRETQRFLDEVKVLIRFDHPHIVRMFDAGVESGLTYYSMELIKGTETRTHVLKNGPMPPLLAVRVGKEVASALAYVHAQRTYHRDLKPQNIMLDQRSQPYKALLIDFGLVTEHLSSADKGLILGTPSYMPPEQAQPRGGHGEVNVTSDLYSLGASIYFLLTGQPPFSGKDPKMIIRSVITEKPKSPDELNPNVPKNVAQIVMKCLEKKQRDRYHGAKQLEADLESVLKSGQMMLKAKSFLGKFLGKPPKA